MCQEALVRGPHKTPGFVDFSCFSGDWRPLRYPAQYLQANAQFQRFSILSSTPFLRNRAWAASKR